jgi:hypothetical protein
MISRTCLLFLPILALAQDQAPPEVDQELRARVNGFYQDFVEGSFSPRKAEAFIAEDTKDYFYTTGKRKFISFRIETVTYSDRFTKAQVLVVGKETKMVLGHVVVMDAPMDTHWKIEDGKWCWTYDPGDTACTPMGGKCSDPGPEGAKTRVAVPKDMSPESIIKKSPMGVDKAEVTLHTDQPGSVQVVFTNGADGGVEIGLDGPVVRGLKATLDKTSVPGHGIAVMTLQFDPADKSGPPDVWEPKGKIPYRIVVSPFNRTFPVFLTFTPSK